MVRETRHLWVGNLPENIREDRIKEYFKRFVFENFTQSLTSAFLTFLTSLGLVSRPVLARPRSLGFSIWNPDVTSHIHRPVVVDVVVVHFWFRFQGKKCLGSNMFRMISVSSVAKTSDPRKKILCYNACTVFYQLFDVFSHTPCFRRYSSRFVIFCLCQAASS